MTGHDKVVPLPSGHLSSGDGNGGNLEGRLRNVEQGLVKVETLVGNAATKADIESLKTAIERLKVWILGGVSALLASWILRWILSGQLAN